MAEGLITLLVEKVIDLAQNEMSKVADAKHELEKLEETLRSIQPILRAAHAKLFTSREDEEEVRDWISRHNHVAYDALDLIDLFRLQQYRKHASKTESTPSMVCSVFNSPLKIVKNIRFRGKISGKIKEINERLCILYNEKDLYGLRPTGGEGSICTAGYKNGIWERHQTTANIIVSDIIGRGNDQETMVEWLLQEEEHGSVSVATIVGMGGVGKTTLAKMIFNNNSVANAFEKRMWVCVSNSPNLLDLFKKILEEVGGTEGSPSQLIGSNALSSRIRKQLTEKKFLLVLDDVWDYNEWWKEMTGLWRGGCRSGSKVVVTTRNVEVANGVNSDLVHELQGLNHAESWQLFVSEALRKGEAEEELFRVKEVAEGIVRRCDGLPLALSAVAGVMRQKERTPTAWQDVLRSPFWSWEGPQSQQQHGSIFSAIALSYMSIPFPLRQCLTYCSIFPKDFEMNKEELLRLWMAEGFVRKEDGMDIEVSAERYFEALVAYNLIQSHRNERSHDQGENLAHRPSLVYTLHDLVHDFALYTREKEHVSVAQLLNPDDKKTPARFCASFGGCCSFERLPEQKIRSLVLRELHSFTCSCFAAFKWLRVLDLRNSHILNLPESIGHCLMLLTYLNLSGTRISKLPESITQIHHMQTLDLSDSHVKTLPEDLSSLSAMRHLDLHGTYYLQYMPKGIGKLTSLRTLWKFVVGRDRNELDATKGCSLMELHDLNHLKGYLAIQHLERVGSEEECQLAQLQNKLNLQKLELSCWTETIDMEFDKLLTPTRLIILVNDSIQFDEAMSRKMENVYEALQPPPNISEITLACYPGVRLPSWMQSLHRTLPFHSLEKICIHACQFLEEWMLDVAANVEKENTCIPRLRQLHIFACTKLRIVPIFPTLEKLTLGKGMDSFEGWDMQEKGSWELWPCLKTVDIEGLCPKLKSLPNGPALQWLSFKNNHMLVFPNENEMLTCSLEIHSMETNNTLRHGLGVLNNKINALDIRALRGLDSLPEWMHRLQQLRILEVADGKELTHLPDWLKSLGKLEVLRLYSLPELRRLPDGLEHLHHLEELTIHGCPKLSSLPDWVRSLPKLRELTIDQCPDLVKRCQNEDQHKIHHIPYVYLEEL